MSTSKPTLSELLASTTQRSNTRSAFVLKVKPESLTEYVAAHQTVWPEMQAALSRSGWKNYSLFLDPATGTIFGYFEAEDVTQALHKIAAEPINTTWQEAMAPFFAAPDGGTNYPLHQYFYLA